jgi:hypothetical protein
MKQFLYTNFKINILLGILFLFCQQESFAQERSATATALTSSTSNELTELNRKANILLNELRALIENPEKEQRFREGIASSIVEKAAVLCPSIELKQLLFGDRRSMPIRQGDKEETKAFIELMNNAIKYLGQ